MIDLLSYYIGKLTQSATNIYKDLKILKNPTICDTHSSIFVSTHVQVGLKSTFELPLRV